MLELTRLILTIHVKGTQAAHYYVKSTGRLFLLESLVSDLNVVPAKASKLVVPKNILNFKNIFNQISQFSKSLRENPAEFTKVSNYVDFIQVHQILNVTTSAYSRFNIDEGAIEAHFLEAAERRADKSRIRRYCTRPEGSNEFTMVNLALQQKRVNFDKILFNSHAGGRSF